MWLMADTPLLAGKIDGLNKTFTPSVAIRDDAVVYINGLAHYPGGSTDNGYVFSGGELQLAEVPEPGDTVAIWQPDGTAQGGQTLIGGPRPAAGVAMGESPTLGVLELMAQGAVWQPPVGSASLIRP